MQKAAVKESIFPSKLFSHLRDPPPTIFTRDFIETTWELESREKRESAYKQRKIVTTNLVSCLRSQIRNFYAALAPADHETHL